MGCDSIWWTDYSNMHYFIQRKKNAHKIYNKQWQNNSLSIWLVSFIVCMYIETNIRRWNIVERIYSFFLVFVTFSKKKSRWWNILCKFSFFYVQNAIERKSNRFFCALFSLDPIKMIQQAKWRNIQVIRMSTIN